MAERVLKEVSTEFMKLEKVGDSVAGVLLRKSEQTFEGKNGRPDSTVGRYTFQPDAAIDGAEPPKPVTILGSTALDDIMIGIKIGKYVKITLVPGEKTSSNFTVKKYKVEAED